MWQHFNRSPRDFVTDFDPECIFEDVKISYHNFVDDVPEPFNKGKYGREVTNIFDFGYCMTVHKAQGNGYDKVLAIVERMSFKPFDIDMERRWLYTAITRAKEKLFILNLGNAKYHSFFEKYSY